MGLTYGEWAPSGSTSFTDKPWSEYCDDSPITIAPGTPALPAPYATTPRDTLEASTCQSPISPGRGTRSRRPNECARPARRHHGVSTSNSPPRILCRCSFPTGCPRSSAASLIAVISSKPSEETRRSADPPQRNEQVGWRLLGRQYWSTALPPIRSLTPAVVIH